MLSLSPTHATEPSKNRAQKEDELEHDPIRRETQHGCQWKWMAHYQGGNEARRGDIGRKGESGEENDRGGARQTQRKEEKRKVQETERGRWWQDQGDNSGK